MTANTQHPTPNIQHPMDGPAAVSSIGNRQSEIGNVQVLCGDVIEMLRGLGSESVQCVVTSPPYWGLRDYGIEGGDWAAMSFVPMAGLGAIELPAWKGCLGLEPTPEMFVGHIVAVFREVWRVLRADGTLWLNLGDSYSTPGTRQGNQGGGIGDRKDEHRTYYLAGKEETRKVRVGPDCGPKRGDAAHGQPYRNGQSGLGAKNLVGIPWRVAFALQAEGWVLRSNPPWIKRNPMPESAGDRPTTAKEDLFLFAKSERYFYDAEAVKVTARGGCSDSGSSFKRENSKRGVRHVNTNNGTHRPDRPAVPYNGPTRSRRNSDWFFESWQGMVTDEEGESLALLVNPAPYKEAHFATFPPRLVLPCLKASTSEKGCCSRCGAPLVRVVEKERSFESGSGLSGNDPVGKNGEKLQGGGATGDVRRGPVVTSRTAAWRATCGCRAPLDGVCVVLDCFGGSGTVAAVAVEMGLRAVLIEKNPEYVKLIERRLKAVPAAFDRELEL